MSRPPVRILPTAIAAFCTAFVAAALFINPGLVDSPLPDGPGLTTDESFNILQGIYLAQALEQHGPLLFTPAVAQQVFRTPDFLPDHPPLARLLIGIAHESTAWLIPGAEAAVCNVAAARLAWRLPRGTERQAVLSGTDSVATGGRRAEPVLSFALFAVEFLLSTLRPPAPAGGDGPPRTWWERAHDWLGRAVGSTGGPATA